MNSDWLALMRRRSSGSGLSQLLEHGLQATERTQHSDSSRAPAMARGACLCAAPAAACKWPSNGPPPSWCPPPPATSNDKSGVMKDV